ncbi:cobalamin biosynthesis protein CobW [Pseudomonas sp. CFBP 8771]|uniref:CobW family GTP-binding protein n=1 Tax=Pseudomonas sp. CFBP 8771 TaxID=2775285 RepID=UPI001785709C|nr:CobW-like GTP-binding protein [Pseudomonas sp. CFBP 8771]MBD8603970.1 cobalamin biosynthesis protein CobW [Pseudomonas sp. CFBP 8771]
MLQNIPTHVIAGPLGAGKTSLIRRLLACKPTNQRWAVLINEFGLVGIDAALLATTDDGIAIGEIAGGCLCCVNGAPFQIGLGRLLRKARPDRLFIEPSGLGHPLQILSQLSKAPWRGVLAVQPLVMVLDALTLAKGVALPAAQREAAEVAGLVIMNKAKPTPGVCITSGLPTDRLLWLDVDQVRFEQLPLVDNSAPLVVDRLREPPQAMGEIWVDKSQPQCQVQDHRDGWSIGWRWQARTQFDLPAVERALAPWSWRRAKLVIHSPNGWFSSNLLAGQSVQWKTSEWRRDSRLELIFDTPQDAAALQDNLQQARVDDPSQR